MEQGHLHPISRAILEIRDIFGDMGFEVGTGPELETEWYNFDALNIPADHPARDMQDTFWVKPRSAGQVFRTHTTAVSARTLAEYKGGFPVRKIFPGKNFRNEATDATHEAQFFQLDGIYVDKGVSLATLKGTLTEFYQRFLGKDVQLRFRPSYFPFTEPSVEVDVMFRGRWLELLGGGLFNPKVLEAAGVDPKEWGGFIFGGGIDRPVMVKYGIDDVRLFYSGDLRLVSQF